MHTFLFSNLLVLSYVGPGAGLTAFGALLAVIAGVVLTFVGFVWYPLRRFLKKMKKSDVETYSKTTDEGSP